MHGNVWEWCQDGRRGYSSTPVSDPVGPLEESANRALRGGGWVNPARRCRSAYRFASEPGIRSRSLGFRLVAGQPDPEEEKAPEAQPGRAERARGAMRSIAPVGLWTADAQAPWPWNHAPFLGRAQGGPRWASKLTEDEFGVLSELDLGGVIMKFRQIEAGTFWMGSPDDEAGRFSDEGPRHEVTLTRGFWMAVTPVTQAQWMTVMGGGSNPSHFKGNNRPVERVSWQDCQEFLSALNQRFPALHAALPTEAQWEYACRAGTRSRFNNGSEDDAALADLGWYAATSRGGTHDVGQKEANGWGLYDMHGNVVEWCQDGLREYRSTPVIDPVGSVQDHVSRVLRGGGWYNLERHCRSAYRYETNPGNRALGIGFRLLAAQPPAAQE